jgi:hypothetical protein
MSDCVGEEEGDFVGVFDKGVGLRGLGGGRGMVVVAWGVAGTLVWIFSGEGGGGFRAAAGRKGFKPLA